MKRKKSIRKNFIVRRLTRRDLSAVRELNEVFADAFKDPDSYRPKPSDSYVRALLAKKHVIVLVAFAGPTVVGGIVAYVLDKFEQRRNEIYLYDLAVSAPHRRKGIARELIKQLRIVAKKLGSSVIFVQADRPDKAAIRLYESFGRKEEPLHFDISVD